MGKVWDVAILGATPAGCAAAYYLARRKCDVIVLDAPHTSNECPLADWAPAGSLRLSGLPASLGANCGAASFRCVRYHSSTLNKQAQYTSSKPVGVFVDYQSLCKALRTAAGQAGAGFAATGTPPSIELEEDKVRVVGATQTAAKLLIVAHSDPDAVSAALSVPARSVLKPQLAAVGLDVPAAPKQPADLAATLNIVELPERSELGMFFALGDVIHLRVISSSPAAGTRAVELSAMVADLQRAGLLPANLELGRARGAAWRPPGGLALELETHVAKRCLLVGTAGGFAEPVTGQTIRPSLASAVLAASCALAALKSPDTQETLMSYKTTWRRSLADYLSPPSTSLRLLLPLLFANQKIVAKFTRALLYGENI